jgi:HEAT repeat protein
MKAPFRGFLLLLATVVFFAAQRPAAAANHPNRSFTFEDRGPEIARLYRLGLENKPENIAVFCEALKSDRVAVREAAIAQLVFTHDESALDAVLGAMEDESTWVRRGAIAVLGATGTSRSGPTSTSTAWPPPWRCTAWAARPVCRPSSRS